MDVVGAKAFIPIWHSFLCPVYDLQMIFLFSVVISFMTVVDDTMSECVEDNCTSYYRFTDKTGSLNPQPTVYILL